MSINWHNLRNWDGSQNKAFEELCCQLASCEKEPISVGAKFTRKGTPDAGVECYWKYPNSGEWGFQAKFFMDSSQIDWSQIDDSVKTALEKHPSLIKYTICLPIDRSDARISNQESCLGKWNKRVEKWREWAQTKAMYVEFDFWGENEIFIRLSREEHAGRYFFWFNKERLSQKWFEDHLSEVIANAGPRYSPEINVELPIAQVFDGLGRTQEFYNRIKRLYGEIRRTYPMVKREKASKFVSQEFIDLDSNITQLFAILNTIDDADMQQINFDRIGLLSNNAQEIIYKCVQILEQVSEEEKKRYKDFKVQEMKNGKEHTNDHPGDFDYGQYDLDRLRRNLYELEQFAQSNQAILANRQAFLIVGKAGTGKTHLFCDIAKNRIQQFLPTVLLLGEQFSKGDPWIQIIGHLHLSCGNREEFLGALDAAAQASGLRAIILIDALNEGEGKTIWRSHLAGVLAVIARYPYITIAFSLRTSYERMVIPDHLVPDKLIREEHHGFAEHEYEATRTFFDFFGIEHPSVPLLIPDFQNPLFLMIFCKALKNFRLTKIPSGVRGITAIFHFFIESVNKKLASPEYLDFDEKRNIVQRAIEKTAELMAEKKQDWLSREDAQCVLNDLLPREEYEKSLFRHLISEGIFAEDIFYSGESENEPSESIRFPYERYSDHMIAKYFIDRYLDIENPSEAFKEGNSLGSLVKNEFSLYKIRGIIEAFCIQLPEYVGKELIELAPYCSDFQSIKEAFIDSLIWRDPKAITDATLSYINDYIIKYEYGWRQFLEAWLTIASNPDHPYNADRLHRNLMRMELAERDAKWSISLRYLYSEQQGSIDRIIDWAWSVRDKSHISDDSVRLCGIVLAWFLTSSNRFLRDRATKALVSLLTNRIPILRRILLDFAKVNDPYISERLYSVAYGCAMRSDDNKSIKELAGDVYELIFRDGTPPPHILLRDYARGVIEYALYRGIELDIEVDKIRPPYRSEWISEIPTEEELKSKYYPDDTKNLKENRGYWDIWFSVMSMGDFARYVIGTNSGSFEWSSYRLNEPQKTSQKQIYRSFVNGLSSEQNSKWEKLRASGINIILKSIDNSSDALAKLKSEDEIEDNDNEGNGNSIDTSKLEGEFLKTLSDGQLKIYQESIIPYLEGPREEEGAFDLSIVQHWIFQKVIDLGWTPELFGDFDATINPRMTREAHKAERIGKKYQWIALHEFLARVSDNFRFREDDWSGDPQVYNGPRQIWRRDIDPSCLISSKPIGKQESGKPAWWFPITNIDWGERANKEDEVFWLQKADDLPKVAPLIQIINPSDRKRWLTLEGFYEWDEPVPADEEKYEFPRRQIWYIIQSYIARKANAKELFEWMKQQDFYGRWMPESSSFYEVFLGEYPWAAAYEGYSSGGDWVQEGHRELPYPVIVPCTKYIGEGNGFDCSTDDTISINLPSSWLIKNMNLRWSRRNSEFVSDDGHLFAFDPTVEDSGPSVLLASEPALLNFLKSNNYEILWTVLGEKYIIGGNQSFSDWKGSLELSGVCRLSQSGEIECSIKRKFTSQNSEREE